MQLGGLGSRDRAGSKPDGLHGPFKDSKVDESPPGQAAAERSRDRPDRILVLETERNGLGHMFSLAPRIIRRTVV